MKAIVLLLLSILTLAAPARQALAQSAPPMEEQFRATADARTRAELSLRKLRSFFDDNESRWRSESTACDIARTLVGQAITRAIQDEQRKTEEVRNQPMIDELSARSQQIEVDWQRFAQSDRPSLEAGYRAAANTVNIMNQTYSILSQFETSAKDARLDLTSVAAGYDALAQRCDQLRQQSQDAMNKLTDARTMWENVGKAATQPVTVRPAK